LTELEIGYSTGAHCRSDPTAQPARLTALGVDDRRVYVVDNGLPGSNRACPVPYTTVRRLYRGR